MNRWARRTLWLVLACCLLTVTAGPARPRQAERKGDDESKRWCFAWTAMLPKDVGERGGLVKAAKWPSASKISISFLDGDEAVRKKVREHAVKWTREAGGPANLIFEFRRDNATDIRISFRYSGSWSVIGTGCKQVPAGQPTMNFGWLTPTTDDAEYRRVVLHEFGHAIGMIHEHQNPAGGIQWNKPQVEKDLSGPPNSWSPDVISLNMFKPYDAKETNFTTTDPTSIMMYPIPANWTVNGFSAGLNSDLSALDKQFIRDQYP